MADVEQRIVELLGRHVDAIGGLLIAPLRELADALVRERIAELVEQLGTPPPITRARSAKKPKAAVPAKTKAAAKSKPVTKTTKGALRQRAVMRCKKCGREGFRADGCGSSHEPLRARDADDEDEPAPRPRPRPMPHRPIEKPLRDRVPEPDDDDEPEPRTPWQPAAAIAARPRCPHGTDAGRCSQCIGAVPAKVAIEGGKIVVNGRAVRTTREHVAHAAERQTLRGRPRKAA